MPDFQVHVEVILYEDNSLETIDDGCGMPIDMHLKYKVSRIELIFTYLHSGAKFSNKIYKYSSGLHEVGISIVNALSKKLIIQVKKEGKIYQIDFSNGEKTSKLRIVGLCNR